MPHSFCPSTIVLEIFKCNFASQCSFSGLASAPWPDPPSFRSERSGIVRRLSVPDLKHGSITITKVPERGCFPSHYLTRFLSFVSLFPSQLVASIPRSSLRIFLSGKRTRMPHSSSPGVSRPLALASLRVAVVQFAPQVCFCVFSWSSKKRLIRSLYIQNCWSKR